jgi:hypothetical protein
LNPALPAGSFEEEKDLSFIQNHLLLKIFPIIAEINFYEQEYAEH